jgi:hypothetical protein
MCAVYYLVYNSILGCRRQSIVALMDLNRSLKLCLTPKHQWNTFWLFAVLGRLLWMQ